MQTIALIGGGIVLQALMHMLVGTGPLILPRFIDGDPILINGAALPVQGIFVFAWGAFLAISLHAFLEWTLLGRAVCACAIDRYAAGLVGIPVILMAFICFILGGLSYNDAWHASHGELGGEFGRILWDGPSLLAEAVKAKKPDFKHVPGAQASIRDGIEEIKNYRALVGVLQYDSRQSLWPRYAGRRNTPDREWQVLSRQVVRLLGFHADRKNAIVASASR